MKDADAQCRGGSRHHLLDPRCGIDRQHVERGRPATLDPRHHRHERRRRNVYGGDEVVEDRSRRGELGIGEHHGSRPELADRGRRLRRRDDQKTQAAAPPVAGAKRDDYDDKLDEELKQLDDE